MSYKITRRDLVGGIAIGAGGLLLGGCNKKSTSPTETAARPTPHSRNYSGYYPPTETGMRGSHEGSYEVAHALSWRGEKPSAIGHWTNTTTLSLWELA